MGKKVKSPPPPDYQAAAQAQGEANLEAARLSAALNRVDQHGPEGSVTYQDLGNDRWAQYTNLSPEQQRIFDETQRAELELANLAGDQVFRVDRALRAPVSTANLPDRVSSLTDDYGVQRDQVIDTVYGRAARHLDPQFAQEEEATRSRLINSGIPQGSEAYDREMDNFYRRREAAYGDARDRAIMSGGQEHSRLLSEALTGANLSNAAREAQLSEDVFLRQLPFNELTALLSGSQVQYPQSGGVPQSQGVQPAPIFDAVMAGSNDAMGRYAQQQAAANANTQGLYSLGGTGIMAAAFF